MSYVFVPQPVASVPVQGAGERFPIRRIFCIGRNYADHVKEMGGTVDRQKPVFFTKPADAVVTDGADTPYPPGTSDLHHEVEMVLALGSGGRDITVDRAERCIFGYAVGLDMTRRDQQARAKEYGNPWDVAKAFDYSAPVSALHPASAGAPDDATVLRLSVNGEVRQEARLEAMLWRVPEIIAELSQLFELKAGDLVFSGTPAGVAAVQRGDRLEAELGDLARLATRIV